MPGDARRVAPRSVVFLASTDSLGTELALPRLAEREAAAVIVDHEVLVSTQWLADRFGIPLVRLDADRWEGALAVRIHLRHPVVERGLKCATAAARLTGADTPSRVADVVTGVLGYPVSVLGPSGVLLAGPRQPGIDQIPNALSGHIDNDSGTMVFASTSPGRDSGSRLTCAVHAPPGVATAHIETILAVADLAIVRLSAWAARSSLSAAWDQASQGAVLTHLLSTGSLDGPHAEQAVALGWQIEGFHIAVMVRPEDPRADRSLVLTALQNALIAAGLTVPAVPLADGWVWWTSSSDRPTQAQITLRSNEVRQIVADLSGLGIAAGVAGAEYGIAGLVRAIGDASRLCRIAGHAAGRRPVETSNDSNPRQYLLTAVTDDQARQRAELLLQPLRRTRGRAPSRRDLQRLQPPPVPPHRGHRRSGTPTRRAPAPAASRRGRRRPARYLERLPLVRVLDIGCSQTAGSAPQLGDQTARPHRVAPRHRSRRRRHAPRVAHRLPCPVSAQHVRHRT